MFEVWASTPETMGPRDVAAHARRAEALGFDGVQVPDAVHDGFLLAAMALAATTRLRVLIGVLVAFPRSPMNVALAAWDLAAMSAGRFALGLGTQVKANIEERYGTRWTPPVPRMREYVGALRAIFDAFQHGTTLDFRGDDYRFTRLQPFFNPGPIAHPRIPLYLGAVRPRMTALAGEIADGLITHPTNTPPRYVREVVRPRLAEGAARADGRREHFDVLLNALVATGPDATAVARARERWRELLGFLYSTPAYWPSLELFGWEAKGEELRARTRAGRWDAMRDVVDDAMLDAFVPSGVYDEIADVLTKWYGGLATQITLALPDDPADDAALARAVAALRRG